MDFDDIGSRLANLTMYDVKQFYTAAKNYALNISDIEAKVNEATSDDPWGASSTLMQEIAQATNNFQDFNEIMPAIYRNFMEREASEWRQIYKALQLLEYIIKHGSERVVDDARSHLGTIKILRNFHYIDEAAKDQGINVRNRAKEIAELLGDVDRIRAERRKARQNRTKYQGAGNSDFVPGSGTGRYGGFGSDSFHATGGTVGDGGGRRSSVRDSFEAYDAGEDEDDVHASSSRTSRRQGSGSASRASAPAKKEAKVADLFSFDDDEPATLSTAQGSAGKAPSQAAADSFDDFDDFQGAPSQSASQAPPQAQVAPSKPAPANVFDFFGDEGSSQSAATSAPTKSAAPLQPQRMPSSSSSAAPSASNSKPATPSGTGTSSFNFDDLWTSSSGSGASGAAGNKQKMSMAEMAKQKSSSAVWGGQQSSAAPTPKGSGAKDPFDFL